MLGARCTAKARAPRVDSISEVHCEDACAACGFYKIGTDRPTEPTKSPGGRGRVTDYAHKIHLYRRIFCWRGFRRDIRGIRRSWCCPSSAGGITNMELLFRANSAPMRASKYQFTGPET